MVTGLERSVFIPIPKKSNAKLYSNYSTITLLSHTSKAMLKILQAKLQQYVNHELPDVQSGLEKTEEPEIKVPTSFGSSKKQESSRKTSTSFTDNAKAFDCVNHNKLWKILEEMGIPDHLTCLLRNLHTGQEATVRTGHGTIDWVQVGKEYVKAVYCHPAYLTCMQSTSCVMLGWMKCKLETRWLGEISITSDMQIIPP